MPDSLFTLDVTTDPAARRATLRLADGDGHHLAAHEVDLGKHPPASWAAAFDTRAHLRRMARSAPAEEQLAKLGDFLGAHVLGPDIAGHLASGVQARTLLVRVPDAPEDPLAVDFARIPWEIARAPGDELTLLQKNVTLRVAFEGATAGKISTVALHGVKTASTTKAGTADLCFWSPYLRLQEHRGHLVRLAALAVGLAGFRQPEVEMPVQLLDPSGPPLAWKAST
jgi:hypothetical protein